MKYNFDSRIIHLVGLGGGGQLKTQIHGVLWLPYQSSLAWCPPTLPYNPNRLLELSHKVLHTIHQNGLSVFLLQKMEFSFFFEPIQYENILKKSQETEIVHIYLM